MREAISGIRKIHRVAISRRIESSAVIKEIETRLRRASVALDFVDPSEIESLAPGSVHQGVVAEVDPYPYFDLEDLLPPPAESALFLILDGIEDPQNFGSLIRTAECCAVDGIVIPKDRSVRVTSTVCKASAGATEHMKIALVPNLASAIKKMKESGIWIYGTSANAEKIYWDLDFTVPSAVVIGSEGKGMRRLVSESCDELVGIPLRGKIGSLNASVAGAIVLFEAIRQRKNQT